MKYALSLVTLITLSIAPAISTYASSYSLYEWYNLASSGPWRFEYNSDSSQYEVFVTFENGLEHTRLIGNIYSDSYMTLGENGLFLSDYTTQFETIDYTPDNNLFLPAVLEDGAQYPYEYDMQSTFDNEYQITTSTYHDKGTVTVHGIESITTELGEFSALRITDTGTSTGGFTTVVTASGTEDVYSTSSSYTVTMWLVEGVGLVRQDSTSLSSMTYTDASHPDGHTETDTYETSMVRLPNQLWTGAAGNRNGWKHLAWFGWFESDNFTNGWIYHEDLHFMYAQGDTTSNIWIYRPNSGWLWTSNQSFPFIYSASLNSWIYYVKDHQGFINTSNNAWYPQDEPLL